MPSDMECVNWAFETCRIFCSFFNCGIDKSGAICYHSNQDLYIFVHFAEKL